MIEIRNAELTVFVADACPDLTRQRLALDMCTDYDPDELAGKYLVLADKFEEIGYSINADRCRAKAARLSRR
jgi:hypothetical protein